MAEFQGLEPTNPNTDNGVTTALGGTKSIIEYLSNIEKNTKDTVSILEKLTSATPSDVKSSIKGDSEAMIKNTQAILDLTDMLKTDGVSVNISGLATPGLLDLLSGSDKKFQKRLHRLEILGDVASNLFTKINGTKVEINGLGETLGAFDSTKDFGAKHVMGSYIFSNSLTMMLGSITKASEGFDSNTIKLISSLKIISEAHKSFSENSVGLLKRASLKKFGTAIEHLYNSLDKSSSKVDGAKKAIEGLQGIADGVKDFGKGAMMIAGAVGILGLSIWAFAKTLSWEHLAIFAGVSVALTGIGWLIDKSNIDRDFLKLGASIAVLGLSLWGFTELVSGKSGMDLVKGIGTLGASLLVLAGANKVLDSLGFSKSSAKNSLGVAAMGASLWVFSKGLQELDTIQMSGMRALELAGMLVGTAAAFAIIGNPITAPFTLVGAGMATAIGAGLFILSAGLKSINGVSVSEENIDSFGMAIKGLTSTFIDIADPLTLPFLIIGVAQSAAVATSSLLMSGAVASVSSIAKNVNLETIDTFGMATKALGDIFSSFGVVEMAKMTAGATVAGLVSIASIGIATSIRAFTFLTSKPESVNMATMSLKSFIDGISNTFDADVNYDSITSGIDAFFGVSKMASEIADTVNSIANLTFIDKEVVNGKVVIKGVRKFTQDDFARVGTSLGSIITALTNPLKAIGSDTGFFGGNDVAKGIDALKNIGSIFNPLTSLLDVFGKYNIDDTYTENFSRNLKTLMGGISGSLMGFDGVSDEQQQKMKLGLKSITDLTYNITNDKFESGVTNFQRMADTIVDIKNNINEIDLGRLTKLNDLAFNLQQAEETEGFENLTKVLKELADVLGKTNNGGTNNTETNTVVNNTNTRGGQVSKVSDDGGKFSEAIIDGNSDLLNVITELKDILLSNTLNVKIADGSPF